MFDALANWFNTFLTGYVATVVAASAGAVAAIALSLLTALVVIYGLAVMRGEVAEPLGTFAWQTVKRAAIIAFATGAGLYMGRIVPLGAALQDGLATLFIQPGYGGAAPATAAASLDAILDGAINLVQQIWGALSIWRLDLLFALALVILGTTIFVVVGAYVAFLAKLVMTFALAIGPFALLCLLLKPTQKFFDGWLSMVVSAAVLSWIVFFGLGLSFYVGDKVVTGAVASGAFIAGGGPTLPSALQAAASYIAVFLVLALLMFQAPSLAAGITGGATIQMGTQAVMNVASVVTAASTFFAAARKGGAAAGGGQIGRAGVAASAVQSAGAAASRGARFAYQRAASRRGS